MKILWVKRSTYIDTKITIQYKCILIEFENISAFRVPFFAVHFYRMRWANKYQKINLRKAPSVNDTYIALPGFQHSVSFCEKENQKTQLLSTHPFGNLEDSPRPQIWQTLIIVNMHGPSHCYMSARKPFYALLSVSNKQRSFMPMEVSPVVNGITGMN